jgi:hypothetical protein
MAAQNPPSSQALITKFPTRSNREFLLQMQGNCGRMFRKQGGGDTQYQRADRQPTASDSAQNQRPL